MGVGEWLCTGIAGVVSKRQFTRRRVQWRLAKPEGGWEPDGLGNILPSGGFMTAGYEPGRAITPRISLQAWSETERETLLRLFCRLLCTITSMFMDKYISVFVWVRGYMCWVLLTSVANEHLRRSARSGCQFPPEYRTIKLQHDVSLTPYTSIYSKDAAKKSASEINPDDRSQNFEKSWGNPVYDTPLLRYSLNNDEDTARRQNEAEAEQTLEKPAQSLTPFRLDVAQWKTLRSNERLHNAVYSRSKKNELEMVLFRIERLIDSLFVGSI